MFERNLPEQSDDSTIVCFTPYGGTVTYVQNQENNWVDCGNQNLPTYDLDAWILKCFKC